MTSDPSKYRIGNPVWGYFWRNGQVKNNTLSSRSVTTRTWFFIHGGSNRRPDTTLHKLILSDWDRVKIIHLSKINHTTAQRRTVSLARNLRKIRILYFKSSSPPKKTLDDKTRENSSSYETRNSYCWWWKTQRHTTVTLVITKINRKRKEEKCLS